MFAGRMFKNPDWSHHTKKTIEMLIKSYESLFILKMDEVLKLKMLRWPRMEDWLFYLNFIWNYKKFALSVNSVNRCHLTDIVSIKLYALTDGRLIRNNTGILYRG